MADIALAIGGLRMTVATSETTVIDVMRERYAGFIVQGPAEWRLRIDVDPRPRVAADGVVVARNGVPDRFDLSRYDFGGSLDLARRVVDVTVTEAHELTLDSLLRVVLSLALIPARGLLVHAASLERAGRGHLFPGVSGAGKTTLARLSTDATLLSDELSIATIAGEGALVHGTPFWGELTRAGEDGSAALAGIYFPRHAARHAVIPLAERAALTRLLPTVMSFAREADVVAGVVDLAADLVARVPCFILDFRRDRGFWEAIEGA
jgi:hypothetical protein